MVHWFWRRWFLNFINVFSIFRNHLPLEIGGFLHLNNIIYPSPKDDLCHVWLKLTPWFWRRFCKIVIVCSLFRNFLPLEKWGILRLKNLISCIQGLAQYFWKRFFKFVDEISQILNYLPLEQGGGFFWTNFNSLYPRMHCAKFGWNWASGSGEDDFSNSSMYFRNFAIISLWKRAESFIWTNLNFLHPKMICAKFGWSWPSGSGGENF